MKTKLTDRQEEILSFIQEHLTLKGFPPTLREIGKKFNIASTFGVKRHLDALVKKGYLNVGTNISRALSIINLKENKNETIQQLCEIPIVGRVAAGMPILAVENIEGNFIVDPGMVKNASDCFALRVKGDSMINAGIYEGDLLIVSPRQNAMNNDIVIALLGDEATVKRFEKRGDQVFLIPENNKYAPILVQNREDFSIVGKVIGVFRLFN
jgi:repressor LexA